jgi:hypothetical protein
MFHLVFLGIAPLVAETEALCFGSRNINDRRYFSRFAFTAGNASTSAKGDPRRGAKSEFFHRLQLRLRAADASVATL